MPCQPCTHLEKDAGEADCWLDRALQSPLYFSIVREDSLLDLEIVRRVGGGRAKVLMVASGGCTAALLAASGAVDRLTLVDCNASQLALSRLKLDFLTSRTPVERLQILGHQSFSSRERSKLLKNHFERLEISESSLGDWDSLCALGPDFVGRYELLFAALRRELKPYRKNLHDLLSLSQAELQKKFLADNEKLSRAIDVSFSRVMALPNLVLLFGPAATSNRARPFDEHFSERTKHAITRFAAVENPYLWQVLAGTFSSSEYLPWLAESAQTMPSVQFIHSDMHRVLTQTDEKFDYIHLSNILDWLDTENARALLSAAYAVLNPGGFVFIRQLNSTTDIKNLADNFNWCDTSLLLDRDRSYFYRGLFLGQKR